MVQLIHAAILVAELGCLAASTASPVSKAAPPVPKAGLAPPPFSPPNLSAPKPGTGAPMARGGPPPPPSGGMPKPTPYSSKKTSPAVASSPYPSKSPAPARPGTDGPVLSMAEMLAHRKNLRSTKDTPSPVPPKTDGPPRTFSLDELVKKSSNLRSTKDNPPPVKQMEVPKSVEISVASALMSETAAELVEKTKLAASRLAQPEPEKDDQGARWSSEEDDCNEQTKSYSITLHFVILMY